MSFFSCNVSNYETESEWYDEYHWYTVSLSVFFFIVVIIMFLLLQLQKKCSSIHLIQLNLYSIFLIFIMRKFVILLGIIC